MRVLVVYESMYGNTRSIAEAIARGVGGGHDVTLLPVGKATVADVRAADLVFVGGPTHMHGESWAMTRSTARDAAGKEGVELDEDAFGPGVRNWFHRLGRVGGVVAAAFDTRFDANPLFTGRAARGITRKLRHHGFVVAVDPESFLIDRENRLVDGEMARAERWAAGVVTRREADRSPVAGSAPASRPDAGATAYAKRDSTSMIASTVSLS